MATGINDDLQAHLIPNLEGLDQRREIGRGAYGVVYEVKLNGVPCIAKGLHQILLGMGGYERVGGKEVETIRAKFLQECSLLSKLKHPNIVQFLGIHYTKEDVLLVMEYMHMDLAKCLDTHPDIPLPLKLSILLDVSYGLQHLHSQTPPIIHRDLTAANVLLTEGLRAKIADLGVSKIFDTRRVADTAAPGTQAYMPPEALNPTPQYDTKLDVFSFGVLSLYTANQEFPSVHEPEMTIAIIQYREVQIFKRKHWIDKMGVDHPLYPLVMQCLQDRPDQRPSTKELSDLLSGLCTQHPMKWKTILEEEKQGLTSEVESLRKELAALRSQSMTSRSEEIECKRLTTEVQFLSNELNKQRARCTDLEVKLRSSSSSSGQTCRFCEVLRSQLADKEGLVAAAERSLAAKDGALAERDARLSLMTTKLQKFEIVAQNTARVVSESKKMAVSKSDLEASSDEAQRLGDDMRRTLDENRVLRQRLQQAEQRQREIAIMDTTALEEELQTKNQQVKQYKRQMDSVTAELDICQEELRIARQHNTRLQASSDEAQRSGDDMRRTLDDNRVLRQRLQQAEQRQRKVPEAKSRDERYSAMESGRETLEEVKPKLKEAEAKVNEYRCAIDAKEKSYKSMLEISRKSTGGKSLDWMVEVISRGPSQDGTQKESEVILWSVVDEYYRKRRTMEQGSDQELAALRSQSTTSRSAEIECERLTTETCRFCEVLKSQLVDKEGLVAAAERSLAAKDGALAERDARLSLMTTKLQKFEIVAQNTAEAMSESKKMAVSKSDLESQLGRHQMEKRDLEKMCSGLTMQLETARKTILEQTRDDRNKQDLRDMLALYENQVQVYKNDFQQERKDRESLHAKFVTLDEEFKGRGADLDQKQKECDTLKWKCTQMEQRCIEMDRQCNEMQHNYAMLQGQVGGLQSEIQLKNQQVKQYKTQVDHCRDQIANYEAILRGDGRYR